MSTREKFYPRGQIRVDDDGELQMRFAVKDGTLIVDFGKPVVWLGFGRADVEGLIMMLQGKLAEMRKQGA